MPAHSTTGNGAAPSGGPVSPPYAARVQADLAAEVAATEARLRQHDLAATQLQDSAYAADRRGDERKAAQLHDRLMRALNAGTTTSQRLQVLRSPGELERRMQAAAARARDRQRLDDLRQRKAEED